MTLSMPTTFTIGSLTTGNFQVPQGEVMKLMMPNLDAAPAKEPEDEGSAFGTHIREAIAIVKDWKKNP
jgi:hypothetical protein